MYFYTTKIIIVGAKFMHETNNFLFLAFHIQFIYAHFIWQILTL